MQSVKVFFELTHYCNYKCQYCFASVSRAKNAASMPLIRFRSAIDRLRDLNLPLSVLLEGGEPLRIKQICDYAEYAKPKVSKLALGTNASMVKSLSKKSISAIKLAFDELSVGFDTVDPGIFKCLTGNPIDPALHGIDILLSHGIAIKICAVMTKYNLDVQSMLSFCETRGIGKLRFYWVISRSNVLENLCPSEEEYLEIEDILANYKGDVDVKLNRYYTPFGNLVVTVEGHVYSTADTERKNMMLLGDIDSFSEIYKKHLVGFVPLSQ